MQKKAPIVRRRAVELTWKIFQLKVVPDKKRAAKAGYSKHKRGYMGE